MNKEEEKGLTKKLSEGNRLAFSQLFVAYYPKVRYFIYGFLKSTEEAEDLTQEVFLKIWTNRARFADVTTFGAYLYVLAKNTTFNYIESRHIRAGSFDEQPKADEASFTSHEELVAKDLQLFVDMIVDAMPAQRKKVYELSRKEGCTNEEISAQLQISKKTVENHLNLALKELRKAILLLQLLCFC